MPICKKPDGTTTEFPYTKQGEKDAQACAEKTGGTVSKVERKPQSVADQLGEPLWTQVAGTDTEQPYRIRRRQRKTS